jgi:hypothetical protein
MTSPTSARRTRSRSRILAVDVARGASALPLTLLLWACTGCSGGPVAAGSYSDVAVLFDAAALSPVAQALQRSLQVDAATSLQPEPLFRVDPLPLGQLGRASLYKNVVVLGLVDGTDAGSRELRRWTAGRRLPSLANGRLQRAVREDVYARNQHVVFLVGTDATAMAQAVERAAPALRDDLERSSRARIRVRLLSAGHRASVEARMERQGGFQLGVPAAYRPTRSTLGPQEGGVEIAAVDPTRTVAVFYTAAPDPAVLQDRDALLALRRRLGAALLQERLQEAGGLTWARADFRGDSTLTLAGFWESEGGEGGGPFRTFFVYDAQRRRLYAINALVFCPGMDKHPWMREAIAVAESFRTLP